MRQLENILRAVFKQYGLPDAIRTDNGSPFASVGIGGLSRLSIWWVRLGIMPERILPGHPEQNGRHERMHRTLKDATVKPPKATMHAQQMAMSRFKEEYNYARPHEALVNKRPGDIYTRSTRAYPRKLPEIEYSSAYLIKRIRTSGEVKIFGKNIYVGSNLAGERIGLKQIESEQYELYFSSLRLGVLDARLCKVIRPK